MFGWMKKTEAAKEISRLNSEIVELNAQLARLTTRGKDGRFVKVGKA